MVERDDDSEMSGRLSRRGSHAELYISIATSELPESVAEDKKRRSDLANKGTWHVMCERQTFTYNVVSHDLHRPTMCFYCPYGRETLHDRHV